MTQNKRASRNLGSARRLLCGAKFTFRKDINSGL